MGVGAADAFTCDVVISVTQNTTGFSLQMRRPRHWKAVCLEISDPLLAGKAGGLIPIHRQLQCYWGHMPHLMTSFLGGRVEIRHCIPPQHSV